MWLSDWCVSGDVADTDKEPERQEQRLHVPLGSVKASTDDSELKSWQRRAMKADGKKEMSQQKETANMPQNVPSPTSKTSLSESGDGDAADGRGADGDAADGDAADGSAADGDAADGDAADGDAADGEDEKSAKEEGKKVMTKKSQNMAWLLVDPSCGTWHDSMPPMAGLGFARVCSSI